jgi:hypothetical protein
MPQQEFQEIVKRLLCLGDQYIEQFDTIRDEIHALGPEVMELVLAFALQKRASDVLDLLVMVLADVGYPPAMPHFVQWLDHENEEVRFASACALDSLADEQFGILQMIEGGWVQHDHVQAAIPSIKLWWQREGQHRVVTEHKWLAEQAARPKYTDREKRYNFIEINPTWVMLGSGPVYQLKESQPLPRDQGIHVVAGKVRLSGETDPREAAIELDSYQGKVFKAFVKEAGWWIDITDQAEWIKPNFGFE